MENPEISVVLPAYNADSYLGAAVDSILSQSFRSFELIVIDDGSNDSTLPLLRRKASADIRLRIISRENRGLVASLNEGIAAARGKWIARMDADDIAHPERLEKQLTWLQQTDADVTGSWIRTFGKTVPRTRRFYTDNKSLHFQLLFVSCFAHPAVMARRTVLVENPYANARHVEDYELWCRLATRGYKFTNTPQALLRYRIHFAQISQTNYKEATCSRARIALAYRDSSYAEIPDSVHKSLLERGNRLPLEKIAEVVDWLAAELSAGKHPSSVLSEIAFAFLARHAEIGRGPMEHGMRACKITSPPQQTLLRLLALLRVTQQDRIFKALYALR